MRTEGQRWRWRVLAAWVVYAVGAALCLGSLGMQAWDDGESSSSMGEELVAAAKSIPAVTGGPPLSRSRLGAVVLPNVGFVLSFVMLIPGVVLVWFAGRSRLYKWLGWVLWCLVLLIGPVLRTMLMWAQARILGDPLGMIGIGYWLWCAGVALMMAAFWVVRTRYGEAEGTELPG